ncbi:STAS domain-containing protein [Alkalilacustris brevis]|uniref:STAS domain-containing protein n=1 Tax=Alkalilacustris brevis TaxID=2026338 RepID=UPI000E0DFB98|nr:STAS domain-containing protein [Alkalilacustris brevis]
MKLVSERHSDAIVMRVQAARIDAAGAIPFKEAVRAGIDDAAARVVLDLSSVQFLDSSGLGAIVTVMKILGPERRLELACLSPSVAKVFRLTRMDSIITIHDTLPADIGGARHAG